jgi:hypothetical protein
MYRSMVPFFGSDEEADNVLSRRKPNGASIQSMTIEEYDREVMQSAALVAQARELLNITQSLTEGGGEAFRTKSEEDTSPRPAARPDLLEALKLRDAEDAPKAIEEPAPVTVEELEPATQGAGLMARPTTDTFSIVSEVIPLSESDWNTYREEVARIESSGRYDIKGGANDHYDGRYQLGRLAKADAAQLLGMDLGHSAKEREAFRKDPELQERAFAAYTAKNHQYLTNKSERYRNLSTEEKLAVLGYAHNQGWSGANKWLETGEEGRDAFGTTGTKYYDAIVSAMASN